MERQIWQRQWRVWRRHRFFGPALFIVAGWLGGTAYVAEQKGPALLADLGQLLPPTALPLVFGAAVLFLAAALQYIETGLHAFADHHRWSLCLPQKPGDRFRRVLTANQMRSIHIWGGAALFTTWIMFPLNGPAAVFWLLGFPGLVACGGYLGFSMRLLTWVPRVKTAVPVGRMLIATAFFLLAATLISLRWAPWSALWITACLQSVMVTLIAVTARGKAATQVGQLYEQALRVDGKEQAVTTGSWLKPAIAGARRFRGPFGAFLVRSLQVRPRVWFNAARLIGAVAATALFPATTALLAGYGFGAGEQVTVWLMGLVFILMIDGAANPTGSEANRSVALLSAPIDFTQVLRAKWGVYLIAFLGYSVLLAVALVLLGDADPASVASGWAQAVPMVVGLSVLMVFGSSFDLDPNRSQGSGLMAKIHDEAPTTPVAIGLVLLAGWFTTAQLGIIAAFEGPSQMAFIAVMNAPLIWEAVRKTPLGQRTWSPRLFRLKH